MEEPWTRKDTGVVAQYIATIVAIGVAVYMWPGPALSVLLAVGMPLGILSLLIACGVGPRVRKGSKRT